MEGVSVSLQALFENMDGKMFAYTPEEKLILDAQNLPWGQDIKYRARPEKKHKVYRGEMMKVYADGSKQMTTSPELIARGENNWVGWDCHIGMENLVVDLRGNVLRGWCGVGGVVGNIADENFNMPATPIVCSSRNCYCGLDIMATKTIR